MEQQELTLEKFEEASEIVKKVTQETKLIYSEFFSAKSGNKVFLSRKIYRGPGLTRFAGPIIRSASLQQRSGNAA